MTFEIEGEYNTATVHTALEREECEEGALEQIQSMADHPAFEGESTIEIMPDFHYGAGAVIGFTMPIGNRVVPNTIGVDIGCGMSMIQLDGVDSSLWEDQGEEIDKEIRETVPMGFNVRSEPAIHIVNEFPWTECQTKLDRLLTQLEYSDDEYPEWFDGYDGEYFKTLCKRVGYDVNRAIMSLGTLGGGNHFIELSESTVDGNVYCTLHSGSRGIGAAIAQHWQDKATEAKFQRNATVEIPDSEAKYFGLQSGTEVAASELSINREAVLEDYGGEAIEGKYGQLKQFMNAGKNDYSDLDYLEGTEAIGYYIDMIFAQTYASLSRELMLQDIADVLGAEIVESIESVHNYIDFNDLIIRKGATRAHDGEYLIIPYNMKEGTVIAKGKGDWNWNNSAPHGAGRVMSRTQAKNELSEEKFTEEMSGIVTTELPLDEAPDSYKPVSLIEKSIEPTAEIVDRLIPIHNLKAE